MPSRNLLAEKDGSARERRVQEVILLKEDILQSVELKRVGANARNHRSEGE